MLKNKNTIQNRNKQKGYITLLSVLIVGAVGVAITVSLLTLGLSSSRTSFDYQEIYKAKALANYCAEEALQQIWESAELVDYLEVEMTDLFLDNEKCTHEGAWDNIVFVINTTGTVQTLSGEIVRKTKVEISAIDDYIRVLSWKEVP